MELICEDCKAVIQIPNERIPVNTTFRVTCPRCKRKIVADHKSSHEEPKPVSTPSSVTLLLEAPARNVEASEGISGETMDALQPGRLLSLLCIDEEGGRSSLKALIEGMGYTVDDQITADHALQRLRFNQYHLVVLSDAFGGQAPNPVASYLATLNMSTRRDMFVVLLGERFKTADHWQAFVESVNLVCHPGDLPQLPVLLERVLGEHERLYRVLNECLIAAGKKV